MDFASSFAFLDSESGENDEIFTEDELKLKTLNKTKKKKFFKLAENSDNDSDLDLSESDELLDDIPDLNKQKVRRIRKADTNILAVKFSSLAEGESNFHTGDPDICQSCSSYFSIHSTVTEEDDAQYWYCEFCGTQNEVYTEDNERPQNETIDYLIEPAKVLSNEEKSITVFCIDTSGSMGFTYEVEGDFKIKKNKDLEDLKQFIEDGAMQWLPGQRTDVTYVSRLQCVQAAIDEQIEALSVENPNKRVVIVDFNTDVTIHHNGKKYTVTGDHLNNKKYLQNFVNSLALEFDIPISENKVSLSDTLFSLQENGQTALGPALIISNSIASLQPGSSVILCTDGIANIGLGSLEGVSESDELHDSAENFYLDVANEAKENGVCVSIMSIKGTNVTLEYIAKVAQVTGGYNDIVDPLTMTKNFNSFLENPIIATDVSLTLALHHGLKYISNEDIIPVNEHICKRDIGNISKESVVTFEYARSEKEVNVPNVPFQVRIEYKKLDGSKCLRVISKVQPVTHNREIAEEHMDVGVIGIHNVMQQAKLAEEGQYGMARMKTMTTKRMVKRALKKKLGNNQPMTASKDMKQYHSWLSRAGDLDDEIIEARNNTDDDSADEEDEGGNTSKKFFAFTKTRKQKRTKNDNFSNKLYQQRSAKGSDYFY